MSDLEQPRSSVGLGVDASGGPVIDPTQNVLDLVSAAIKRQDDLREAESRHVREIAGLRAEYQAELRMLETERINAIRAVDAAAVQQASAVAEARATALAGQVSTTADATRIALAAALEPIQRRIEDLSRAQYEAQGSRTQVVVSRSAYSATASIALGVAGLVLTAIIIAVGIYAAFHK